MSTDHRKFKKTENMWAIQCGGGCGFIHGTNSSTRRGAIAEFRHGWSDDDHSWEELSGPRGHYRVVKVEMKVKNW